MRLTVTLSALSPSLLFFSCYAASGCTPVASGPDGGNDSGTGPSDSSVDVTASDSAAYDSAASDAGVDAGGDAGAEAGLPTAITVTGNVVDATGAAIAGVVVTSGAASAQSQAGGAFTLAVSTATARTVVRTTAPGYAPMLSVVKVKPGVTAYALPPIELQPLQDVVVATDLGGQLATTAYGQPVTVVLAPGAVGSNGNAYIRAASFDARTGPGTMESIPGDAGTALQSAGMFYVDVVGPDGGPMDLADGGLSIQLGGQLPPSVAGAGPLLGWQLDPSSGLWSAPQSIGDPTIQVTTYGFWNADRNYQTACVTGKVVATQQSCAGNWIRAAGPDGLSSFDETGSDGSFCVDGAQTWPTILIVGATEQQITMPASAGDCSVPTSCQDIGTVVVSGCVEPTGLDGGVEEAASPCPSPGTLCGTLCVDLQYDINNCGTCGNACANGDGCLAGVCTPSTGQACGNLTEGDLVPFEETEAAAPSFTGGTIASGTYVMTALSGPSCPGAVPTAATLQFTATSATSGTFIEGQSTVGSPGDFFGTTVSGTYTTNGSSLTLTINCPEAIPEPATPYTASPTQIAASLEEIEPGCLAYVVLTKK